MEEYAVKLKVLGTGTVIDGVVSEEEQTDEFILRLTVCGREFIGRDYAYHRAFQKLRDGLLGAGYGICCKGALINAVQSEMMSGCEKVYLVELGRQARMSDVVFIYEFADMEDFPDTAAQEGFEESWYDSIGKQRGH